MTPAAKGLLISPAASGIPGKTGQFDESVSIDSHPWLHPFLVELVRNRPSAAKLFPVSAEQARGIFTAACDRLGLGPLRPSIYGLRHGGASFDLLHKRRTMNEIKLWGRWSPDASLKRYAKESRLLQETHKIPAVTHSFGILIDHNLERSFNYGPPGPSPIRGNELLGDARASRKRPAAA